MVTRKIYYFTSKNDDFFITEFGFSDLDRDFVVGPRIRNSYILHIVIKDVCRFSDFDAPEGTAFLISKNKPHSFQVSNGYQHFWIAFDGKRTETLLDFYGISATEHILFELWNKEFAFSSIENAFNSCSDPTDDIIPLSLLHLLFSLLKSNTPDTLTCNHAKLTERYIRNNYYRKISITAVAESVHISEKHLCKLFKNAYGMPPVKYLKKLRMEKAARLLKNSNMKIKEIADSVGYDSQLNFTAAFKDYYKVSPTEYKKEKST